jgi:hypothetical protein
MAFHNVWTSDEDVSYHYGINVGEACTLLGQFVFPKWE